MLCIKKNKCFSTVLLLSQKKQTAYCNPFRPVETRLNLSKHVETRSDLLKPVETRSDLSRPVSRLPPLPLLHPPFSPLLPLFPFLWGGREGGGETPSPKTPRKGEGGDEVPPLRILNKKLSKFSHSFFFKIFKICVIYPYYPLKVSLSVHCCCCSKLHKHLWRRCPLNKKQNSFIHCGILK